MVIINPTVHSTPAALNRPAGPAPILPPDKVLMATVLGQRAEHLYELASGNLRLMAESQTALRSGEALRLQVKGYDHQQRPVLQVLADNAPAVANQLRQVLPQQQPLTAVLASLGQLAGGSHPEVPLAVLARQFLQTLPHQAELRDPRQLRRYIFLSGMFREHAMAHHSGAQAAPPADLKSALLNLAQRLAQLPKQSAPAEPGRLATPVAGSRSESQALAAARQTNASPVTEAAAPLSGTYSRAPGPPPPSQYSGQAPPQPPVSAAPSTTTPPAPKSVAAYASLATHPSELPGVLTPQPRSVRSAAAGAIPVGPEQLLQEIKGAIARIESHQLLHLQHRDPQHSQYTIELPIRDADGVDLWQLQLQRQQEQEAPPQQAAAEREPKNRRAWQVTLTFALPGLGAIRARVSQQEEKLTMNFTLESAVTHALFGRFHGELVEALCQYGLADIELNYQCGKLHDSDAPQWQERPLVETRA